MDKTSFNILVGEVKKQGICSNKKKTIEISIKSAGTISPEQAAELVKLIPHDSDQLEVAKMAFEYSTNKGAYAIVVSKALRHSSTRDELNKFIVES